MRSTLYCQTFPVVRIKIFPYIHELIVDMHDVVNIYQIKVSVFS